VCTVNNIMLVSEAYITSEWNDQEWVRPMTAGHHRLPDTISSDILDTTNGVRVWMDGWMVRV